MRWAGEDIVGWLSENFGSILKKSEVQIGNLILKDMGIRNYKDLLVLRNYSPEGYCLHFGAEIYDSH